MLVGRTVYISAVAWSVLHHTANSYSQVNESPARLDALLDVYLVQPKSSVTSNSIVQGISDHNGVILEIDWEENAWNLN